MTQVRHLILLLAIMLGVIFLAVLRIHRHQPPKNLFSARQRMADNIDAFFIQHRIDFQGPFFIEPHGIRYIMVGDGSVLFDAQKDITYQEEALQAILKKVKMKKERLKLIDLMPGKPHVALENY